MHGHQFAELFSIDLYKNGNLCDPSTQFGYPSLILIERFVRGVAKNDRKIIYKDSLNISAMEKAFYNQSLSQFMRASDETTCYISNLERS